MWANEIPDLLQWSEGMLLAPQHFQLSATRAEMLSQYGRLVSAPYCWGVRRLEVDKTAIPSGAFRVLELEAILPDGSLAVHNHQEVRHDDANRDLVVNMTGTPVSDIPIYLVVPARSAPGVKGTLPRYQALAGDPVADENTGEGELRPAMLRPRLSLMAGEEPPPKFVSMQIGCMRFKDETWVQTEYVPPAMTVPVLSPLGQMCALLVKRLREKAMFISERFQSPSISSDATTMLDNRLRMLALVSRLPALEGLLNTGSAHPFELYLECCAVAGGLATLGASLMPPVFPAYRHEDARASLQTVCSFGMRMTEEGVPETYRSFPFHQSEGVYGIFFDPEWMDRRLVLGMRVSAGASDKDTIAWASEALIGSESIVPALRDKRIRGAARQFIEIDPDLIPGRGVVLFALTAEPEFIKQGETLQVLNFGERARSAAPLEILLFVKN